MSADGAGDAPAPEDGAAPIPELVGVALLGEVLEGAEPELWSRCFGRRSASRRLLIEFAEARFDFFQIIGKTLHLRGHGVQAGARVGLDILNGFLDAAHGGVEFADVVAGLLDQSFEDGMVLRDLRGHVLLTLKKCCDVSLQVDDFSSDGLSGTRPDDAAAERPGKNSGGENEDVADSHEKTSKMRLLLGRMFGPGEHALHSN